MKKINKLKRLVESLMSLDLANNINSKTYNYNYSQSIQHDYFSRLGNPYPTFVGLDDKSGSFGIDLNTSGIDISTIDVNDTNPDNNYLRYFDTPDFYSYSSNPLSKKKDNIDNLSKNYKEDIELLKEIRKQVYVALSKYEKEIGIKVAVNKLDTSQVTDGNPDVFNLTLAFKNPKEIGNIQDIVSYLKDNLKEIDNGSISVVKDIDKVVDTYQDIIRLIIKVQR